MFADFPGQQTSSDNIMEALSFFFLSCSCGSQTRVTLGYLLLAVILQPHDHRKKGKPRRVKRFVVAFGFSGIHLTNPHVVCTPRVVDDVLVAELCGLTGGSLVRFLSRLAVVGRVQIFLLRFAACPNGFSASLRVVWSLGMVLAPCRCDGPSKMSPSVLLVLNDNVYFISFFYRK